MLATYKKNIDIPPITFSKEEFLKYGKNIIQNNSFFYTLHLLLKYYFVKNTDFYLINFLKDITNTEVEFKTFMVYIEFSVYTYNSYLKDLIDNIDSEEDIVYILIAYVKKIYDNDRAVLKPFINSLSENEDEIIEKFNNIKNIYKLKLDALQKIEKLNNAIYYLEKAKQYENEAKKCTNTALDLLKNLKGEFKTVLHTNESHKFILKNK